MKLPQLSPLLKFLTGFVFLFFVIGLITTILAIYQPPHIQRTYLLAGYEGLMVTWFLGNTLGTLLLIYFVRMLWVDRSLRTLKDTPTKAEVEDQGIQLLWDEDVIDPVTGMLESFTKRGTERQYVAYLKANKATLSQELIQGELNRLDGFKPRPEIAIKQLLSLREKAYKRA